MSHVPARLRRLVVRRAANRCEYCQLAQVGQEATFHVDHIIPEPGKPRWIPKRINASRSSIRDTICGVNISGGTVLNWKGSRPRGAQPSNS